jgi:hypothetical protein
MNHLPRPELPEGWVVLAADDDGEMLVWAPHNLMIVNAAGDTTGNVFIGGNAPKIAFELDRLAMEHRAQWEQ